MGKGKKHKNSLSKFKSRHFSQEEDSLPSSAYNQTQDSDEDEEESYDEEEEGEVSNEASLSKFDLYQKSVQMPKGDISYLLKFFLMYVGGRLPLHLQEDFCGTALLSCEWLKGDPRRTAVGLDFDKEALNWCLDNNLNKIGSDGYSRIFLFDGNVLQPQKAILIKSAAHEALKLGNLNLQEITDASDDTTLPDCITMAEVMLPGRDIICAFNYSCCCLQKRNELLLYLKHVLRSLSKNGGIFVMDVYGGTSSECKLRLQRKFSNFTYVWEQAEFDIINRRTRISLHFQLGKKQTIKHAFSYEWRLWSLPEIRDCLLEAGFQSVHVWIREMPNTEDSKYSKEYNGDRDAKYEESSTFEQTDAWNAYIVGVANLQS